MKKILLAVWAVFFLYLSGYSQTEKSFKAFISDIKIDAFVGMGPSSATYPFDEGIITSTFGVNLRKPLRSIIENKLDLYALSGLHFNTKGAVLNREILEKHDQFGTDVFKTVRKGGANDFGSSTLSIPAYLGIKYHLLDYLSIFTEVGIYAAFAYGGYDYDGGMTRSFADLGVGYNIGLEFKRVSLRAGLDVGLTPVAKVHTGDRDKYIPNTNKILRNIGGYLSIGWRLHGKRK